MISASGLWGWGRRQPAILTESRSVTGVLRNTINECRARIAPVGGHCTGFLRTIAAKLSPGDTVAMSVTATCVALRSKPTLVKCWSN
jgi:hypothetical protein